MKRKILVFILTLVLCTFFVPFSTFAQSIQHDNAQDALHLINEIQRIALQRDVALLQNESTVSTESIANEYNSQIALLEKDLLETGVDVLTANELVAYYNASVQSSSNDAITVASNYPSPENTDTMTFYKMNYPLSSGKYAHYIVAAPVTNSDHPACQEDINSLRGISKAYLSSLVLGITSLTELNNVRNTSTEMSWRVSDLSQDFFDENPSIDDIDTYELAVYTRTITMFVYMKNSYDEPVYYGSTNCTHVDTVETLNVDSESQPEVRSQYQLILSDYYHEFPEYCVSQHPDAFAVTLNYSFVRSISIISESGNRYIHITPPCYTTLYACQAASI